MFPRAPSLLRPQARRLGHYVLALCLALSACTDADISRRSDDGDASPPSETPVVGATDDAQTASAPDGGYVPTLDDDAGALSAPVVTVLPDWAAPLLGRFAARAYTYKQDDLGSIARSEDVYLSVFSFSPDTGLTLRSKLCLSRASSQVANVTLRDPSRVPERVEQVVLSELDRRFRTEAPTLAVGFTREPPAECAGKSGQNVPKPATQVWIAGTTCRCARRTDEPVRDDCRVLDPDGDDKPGFSFDYQSLVPPLGDAMIYAVSNSDTHYVNGTVSAAGSPHEAGVIGGEHPVQLDCDPLGCANVAGIGRYCPLTVNTARFVRLEDNVDCTRLVADYERLFPDVVPARSERCYP